VQPAFAVWLTGLPASGKSTVRACLVTKLASRGVDTAVLESDVLREILGWGYDETGRDRFYRTIVWIGKLLVDHGVPVVFDATANRRVWRDHAREQIPRFFEVYVDTPLEVCTERDPKGIYRRGREDPDGRVPGLQAPYEPPESAEVTVSWKLEPEAGAESIIRKLEEVGWVNAGSGDCV
jgi:adenylylsulfate kinase